MPKNRAKVKSPTKYRQQSILAHLTSSPERPRPRRRKPSVREYTESDSESNRISPPPKKSRTRHAPANDSDSDTRGINFVTESSSSESNNNGPILSSPAVQRRPTQRIRVVRSDSDQSMGAIKSKRKQRFAEEPESDFELAPRTRKRRIIKGTRPSSDESDNILDGLDENKILGNKLRTSKKSAFLQNLEKLKRKKKGITESSDDNDSEQEGHETTESLIPGARRDSGDDEEVSSASNEDSADGDDNDDFIVEDDGVVATLPAEFSMTTYQDLAHHFKIVCQYFVHIAVSSESARERISDRLVKDDYFRVPLSMTRQKLGDLQESLVSSVWKSNFKKALNKYPEFDLVALEFSVPHCDACNISKRISTLLGRLGGVPYDKKTFAAVHDTDSDSSEDSTESNAPEFNLGRFCARRTNLYHNLSHWEYDLFWTLYREVATLSGEKTGFVRAAASDVPPPDDITDADQVMQWLDDLNVIHEEWQKVKKLMTDTTNFEADARRGDDDRL